MVLHWYLLIWLVSEVHKLLLEKTHKGLITDSTKILHRTHYDVIVMYYGIMIYHGIRAAIVGQ